MRRSGSHEELQRANGEADEDAEAGQGGEGEKKKKISRVFRYAFMMPHDNNVTAPMFVIGYQELYNTALTEVTAIRIWKFVRCTRTPTHSLHTPYSRSSIQLGICKSHELYRHTTRRSLTRSTRTRSCGAS